MPRRPRKKQPKKSKPLLPAPEDDDQDVGWYIIKDIINERRVRSQIEYLVDWENNPQTGEIYDPTWTKSRDVTKEAIKEWEARKLANKQKAASDKGDKSKLVTDCDNQKSKPEAKTRPSLENNKPKRTTSVHSTRSGSYSLEDPELEQPPRKKSRLGFSSSPVAEATPSFISTTSRGSVEQTSEEVETPRAARTFLVEFKKGPNFDPSEYLSTHGASQTTNSSQPLAKPESSPLRQSFQTIPDSQDPASLNTPVSEPSSVQKRPRSSQLPRLLIPDSQNETQESGPATHVDESQQQDIVSIVEYLSDHSDTKEEAGSTGTTCDIPSHQVNVQNDELQVSQTETVAQVSSSCASCDTPDGQLGKAEKDPEPEPFSRQTESTLEELAPVSQGSVQSLSAELPSEPPLEEPNSRLSQAAQAPPSPLESVLRGSSPSADTGIDRPSAPVEEVKSVHIVPQNSASNPLNRVDHILDESSENLSTRFSQESKIGSLQGDAAYASATKLSEVEPGGHCSLAESSSRQAIKLGPHRESSTKSAEQAEDRSDEVAGKIETAAKYAEAQRVPEKPRSTFIQRSLSANSTQEREETQGLSSQGRRSRLSATELVQDVIEHWDQPDYDPMSSNMFSEGPEDSDSGKRVSAVAELQSLWDVEPVHESTQAGIESGVDPVPASEPASITTADVHRNLLTQANPLTQEIPFFSQPQGQIASWTPELSTDLSHISGGTMEPGERSATQTMQDLINQTYGSVDEPVDETMLHPAAQDVQPATVSPADVSQPTEAEKVALPVLPLSSHEDFTSLPNEISGNSITMAQVPQTQGEPSSPASSTSSSDSHLQHIITIPFQASIRSLYHETLNKHRQAITDFGEMFTTDTWEEPDPSLVQKIDSLFIELQNLCDFPEDILEPSVRDMPTEEKVKYSLNANAKLTFIYELLDRAKETINVLIVARSPTILRMLCDMAEFSKLECTCDVLEYKSKESFRDSPAGLTLVLPTGVANIADYDVVIGYDTSFDNSVVGRELSSQNPGSSKPLVLRLVTAYSIEHISLEIPGTSNELERRNAMLFAMVYVRSILRDPPRLMEPHKVAAIFSDYLNNETEQILWEPVDIPPLALEVFANSQNATQMPADNSLSDMDSGRKRRHDDDHEPDNKRQRVYSQTQPSTTVVDTPPMGDQLKGLLETVGYEGGAKAFQEGQLSLPLSVLEAIAEKVAEGVRLTELNNRETQYKDTIARLEKQVKEFEKTNEQFYESQRQALQDRTKFQTDARKAEEALQTTKEATKANDEKTQKRISELEESNARLMKNSPAGANETILREANAKVQVLEKRLETSHKNEEYTRQLYQDATGSTSAMRAELQEVKELNEELKKKASENLRNIHETNNNNAVREYVRQVSELQARLKDREMELDRVREELRQVKNGRRETRQASVPRSPRMGMMSPRTARPFGASSRAGSPAPVMGSFESPAGVQTGNGRFSHLRE